jgi:hypothetical protein
MGQEWKFPSHIAPVRLSTVDLGDKATGYLWQGTRYVVGEPWNESTEAEKYSKDISYLIDYSPLFVTHALKNIIEIPEVLAIGLPLEQFRSHREMLRKCLSSFNVDGKTYNFDLRVFAQSVGALAHYTHLHTPSPEEDGFVIDVGFNTALILRYQSLQAKSDGSGQYSQFGIMRALETLGSSLKSNLGESFTPLELNQICQQGFVKKFGNKIDVSELIKAAITNHIETLCMTIENDYGRQLSRVDRLVLAGGGAYSMARKLPEKYSEYAVILQNPEYANAHGYWLLAGGQYED